MSKISGVTVGPRGVFRAFVYWWTEGDKRFVEVLKYDVFSKEFLSDALRKDYEPADECIDQHLRDVGEEHLLPEVKHFTAKEGYAEIVGDIAIDFFKTGSYDSEEWDSDIILTNIQKQEVDENLAFRLGLV